MEEDRLPDTLTPKVSSQEETVMAINMPWGRLLACKDFLENLDLVDDFFSFGRSEECTQVVTAQLCPSNMLFNISKMHFTIEKSSEDNLIYISDSSKNGTFVNGVKLGTGRRRILKNDDVIGIALPAQKFYIFKFLQVVDDFLPENLVAKYANIKRLGRGSCGEVRLVRERDTSEQYAIKKIILGESHSSQVYRINHPSKITNEIEILRSLSHPCIIGCKEVLQCEREVYLVLEYMAGGELTQRILNSPMTEDCVKFYFLQMLYGVQYLHTHGVIHRDLKPENILLLDQREETTLKITDFGLSKITQASDMTTMCGTLRYVAPEVISCDFRDYGEYGKKVDVWSLGVILFFMLSREYPFKGENNIQLAENIKKSAFDMSSVAWFSVHHQAKDLIKRILVVQPRKRIDILRIINHPWIKNDYGVKYRVEKLLQQEGLENPFQDLVLEQPEKKFKFSSNIFSSSSSSGELDSTLVFSNGSSSYSNSPTMCC